MTTSEWLLPAPGPVDDPGPGPAPPALLGLWALTGLAGAVTVLGLLSIGLLVAPLALGLLVVATVLTARHPALWPCVVGVATGPAAALVWLGVVLGGSDPASGSCSATADGVVTCTSDGRAIVPGGFEAALALPWFVAAAVVLAVAVGGWVAGTRRSRLSASPR